jgi:hypothetical protein
VTELILHAKLTEVTVCVLPESSINHGSYAVTVSYRGDELYAVMHRGWCLGRNGKWDHEPQPSSRTKTWIASHRFDYDTAYRLAGEVAPTVTVNGRTALEAADLESRSNP